MEEKLSAVFEHWTGMALLLVLSMQLAAWLWYRHRLGRYRLSQAWPARRLGLAVAGAGLGVWEWQPASGKLYWSPAVFGFYGLAPSTHIDIEQWKSCLPQEAALRLEQQLRRGMAEWVELELELPFRQLKITGRWVYEGRRWRLIGLQQDVSASSGQLRQMSRQAYQDRLTGLPNRSAMVEQLAAFCRPGQGGALLFLDLDGFKAVNDELGHDAGDALLQAVAERLGHSLRLCDRVYRLGGDEFVVWLTVVSDSRAAASRVATLIIQRLEEPFELGGRQCRISTSLGIALCPADGDTPETLLKAADQAMYRAKRAGKGRYAWAGEGESTSAGGQLQAEKIAPD